MDLLAKLKYDLGIAEEELYRCSGKISAKRKELVDAESQLIELREKILILKRVISELTQSKDELSSVDDVRENQIQSIKEKLPDLLEKISSEKKLDYISLMDFIAPEHK